MKFKSKIAIISFTSFNGCQKEILTLGKKFLNNLNIEIKKFPLIKKEKDVKKYDIIFIKGSPATKEELKELKSIRKKTKFLVALGACACLHGVSKITIKNICQFVKRNDKLEIKPLRDCIKIDFELPGCPVNKNEFYWVVCQLLSDKIPKISQTPVCYECQLKENECLLQKGLICLGPLILGGCEAVCLKFNLLCDGCRGLLKDPKIENYIGVLEKYGINKKEFEKSLEKFNLK
ncbi:hypothetical protein CVV26_01485 [Candidatus Kuenenbacteria bacterium HGW-Kuenenbacteria-1]|uniref:NADH:ubiquinone oxidoreductase-like 20kDa subunit domain-containing protein n=1 Tax=Candidatus Kuenenbacteria bacterium HGW-Kuenenbacteria-1 TaxID=2013812 RepID=A0A2N1UNV8_9BACT|nr:MAG: hypothetical protein CVV26_01485 [Candidatus Kuenenbacteria bacterium HGW-Kuenenbacteria-1]